MRIFFFITGSISPNRAKNFFSFRLHLHPLHVHSTHVHSTDEPFGRAFTWFLIQAPQRFVSNYRGSICILHPPLLQLYRQPHPNLYQPIPFNLQRRRWPPGYNHKNLPKYDGNMELVCKPPSNLLGTPPNKVVLKLQNWHRIIIISKILMETNSNHLHYRRFLHLRNSNPSRNMSHFGGRRPISILS